MASPPPSSPPSEKPEKSKEGSELPPLDPNSFLSHDLSSNDCRNPNYDAAGFQTAPSSPPHDIDNLTADSSSLQKERTVDISSPSSPKLLQQPNMRPFPVLLKERDAVPSHHLLKVEQFSLLSKAPVEKYSSEFGAGGYKWNHDEFNSNYLQRGYRNHLDALHDRNLSIYPTGDKNKDGEGHISIYLEMADTSSLPAGWEINAIFNFFIYDQLRDKYASPQDASVRRFHCMKTQWGIVKFIDLEAFSNPSNGYLVNDTCSFGVEVFIIKTTSKAERLSMINDPLDFQIIWIFHDVSKRTQPYETGLFVAGDYKWSVMFYPGGYQVEGKRNSNITAALKLDTSTLPFGTKLFLHYTFRLMDQKKDKHVERSDARLISSGPCGFLNLTSQTKLKNPENGFLVDDKCKIEVKLKVLGLVKLE